MTEHPESSFSIDIHRDIAPLEDLWRGLEQTGVATAFQCYDFVAPLYGAFTAHGRAEPLIVLVRETVSRRPVMILPLCRHRQGALTVIAFADLRVSDYCAPVLAADFRPDAATFQALWKRIARALPRNDIVWFRKLPRDVGGRPNPILDLGEHAPYHVRAHGVVIAHPWRERSVGTIPKKSRGEIRRNEKHLEQLGPVTFEHHSGGAEAEAAFEILFSMRRERFAILGRDDVFTDPMWSAFYRDLVYGRTARPAAHLVLLRSGGVPVACDLGLVREEHVLVVLKSFDMERFGRFSPGKLLVHRAMEAFAEAGFTYFDLTIGDEPYKHQFGTDDRELYELLLPQSLAGRLAELVWRSKVLLRRYPRLRVGLKRLLQRSGT